MEIKHTNGWKREHFRDGEHVSDMKQKHNPAPIYESKAFSPAQMKNPDTQRLIRCKKNLYSPLDVFSLTYSLRILEKVGSGPFPLISYCDRCQREASSHIQTDHVTVCSLDTVVHYSWPLEFRTRVSQQLIYTTVEGYGAALHECGDLSSSILQEGAGWPRLACVL